MRFSSGTHAPSPSARSHRAPRSANVLLWSLQGLLALLFVFAGASKLMMPIDVLTSQTGLPGFLLKFVGVAEIAGGLGLVLPGFLHLRADLTPLAAAGLLIIMIGAVILTAAKQGIVPAIFPFIVGCLLAVVIRGRWIRTHVILAHP